MKYRCIGTAVALTLDGTVEHRPQTDAEWLELRHAAIRLAESANLKYWYPNAPLPPELAAQR